jgi:nucleoside-diphosphate kinase
MREIFGAFCVEGRAQKRPGRLSGNVTAGLGAFTLVKLQKRKILCNWTAAQEIHVSQRTFSIIKPDAVKKGDAGAILAEIQKAGFKIVSIKKISISKAQAEGFYHVHAARPFFGELTEFMSSGAIFPMVLEKENAIADLRKLMGATDPAKAEEGTIRKMFAASIGENAIHGSDAEDTAAFEIAYFFAGLELV